jgi:hypothetical protein
LLERCEQFADRDLGAGCDLELVDYAVFPDLHLDGTLLRFDDCHDIAALDLPAWLHQPLDQHARLHVGS